MIDPKNININDFDYPLPDERIAKYPLKQRDKCKLLVRGNDGVISTHLFTELPDLLSDDTLLIYNNTRVINARLRFRKGEGENGATIEIFCLDPQTPRDYALNFASTAECSWSCFIGNSKRWKQGYLTKELTIDGKNFTLTAERLAKQGNSSIVQFKWDCPEMTFSKIIETIGEIPIPPYLNRSTESTDSTDYQTVYSHIDGSVAAPTAGLHFTDDVLKRISEKGIQRRELTLHVGAGTFQPVKSDTIGEHDMHTEFIEISRELIAELAETDKRVTAVGTTSVRTLESLYHIGCLISEGNFDGEVPQWYPYSPAHPELSVAESLSETLRYLDDNRLGAMTASTRIIIAPGYKYRIVNQMITNFHQPKSTLLLLVSAFIGKGWRQMYDFALENGYRFLSYGDAQLLSCAL